VALEADFLQRCGGPDEPFLTGRISYQA